MKILLTGGYGNISWWCTKKAIDLGYEVYVLNREQTTLTRRPIPAEAILIKTDYRNFEDTKKALEPYSFDVVCDFLCQGENHARTAYELFKNKTKQYILISSGVVYKRHEKTEEVFNENSEQYSEEDVSPYILGKLQSEKFFLEKYKSEKFPVTIVRPGYTLDNILPYMIGHNCYTIADRYLREKPFLMAGSGDNLCTFTHSKDFAEAFIHLCGNIDSIGEAFNLTGDNVKSYNDVMSTFAKILAPQKNVNLLYIPYAECLNLSQFMPKDLMIQRMNNEVFDNSKIKSFAPDWKTTIDVKDIIALGIQWLNEDSRRIRINKDLDTKLEELTEKYKN